ncbi:MAG: hypothetical protein EBZ77_13150 [Chitinophagia bacterium]|nr:hypothetical protein [Chitinophagia bacterium]
MTHCVTLLSDFGHLDASVPAAKGILLSTNASFSIIDIAHDVWPFHLGQAAYLLASASRNFPPGTVHLALMDIFGEKNPTLVACEYESQIYLAPDNGLLPACFPSATLEARALLTLNQTHRFRDWMEAAAGFAHWLTMHPFVQNTFPIISLKPYRKNQPSATDTSFNCDVIHIDEYENVVVDFTKDQFERLQPLGQFKLSFVRYEELRDVKINYTDVSEGRKLCRFNSNGYLEICVNNGKAASLFGLKPGGKHNNIKISFL